MDFTDEAHEDDLLGNHPHLDKDSTLLLQVSPRVLSVLTFYITSLFKQRIQEISEHPKHKTEDPQKEASRMYYKFCEQWEEHSEKLIRTLGTLFHSVQQSARSSDGICCLTLKDEFLEQTYDLLATQLEAAMPHSMSLDVKCKLLLTVDIVKMVCTDEFLSKMPESLSKVLLDNPEKKERLFTVYLDVQLTGTGMNSTQDFSTDILFSNALSVNQNILDNLVASDSRLKHSGDDAEYGPVVVH